MDAIRRRPLSMSGMNTRRFVSRGMLLALVAAAALASAGAVFAQTFVPVQRTEVEPNNSHLAPDPVPVLTDTEIRASISVPGDRDFFRVVVVGQQRSVRFETFVPTRPTCTGDPFLVTNDTVLRLYNAAGQLITADDDSGTPPLCSLIVRNLAPGTYFIEVLEFLDFVQDPCCPARIIPAYTLEIDFEPDQPLCPPNEDEDDDGLRDDRENLFSTLLGNGDSDDDGIRDGNDDSDNDGEDDEDEDDDENGNNGCPDEDSDDDGEDDEDEDDDD
jgi:hypothetical protein